MAALQYVDVPGYHALLLRRTFAALSKPGALIDLAHDWLQGTDATWNEQQKQWTFPSGATLSFGYLDIEKDKYQYQGAAYQFVGWDELTQFTPTQYKYLFSRRRRTNEMKAAGVPMRTRAASNPGGEGHEWVKHRFFVEGPEKRRVFIPAKLQDNPYLDVEEYRESLAELPLVERMQLENGDWETKEPGEWFQREWLEVIEPDAVPLVGLRVARYWDTASTKPHEGNKDPDYFCGVKLGELRGVYYVLHVTRFRCGPAEAEAKVEAIAHEDGKDVDVWMAQEPGSMSEMALHAYAKGPLAGFTFRGDRQTGDKRQRAKPLAAAASRKAVKLVRGAWNSEYLDELEAFPRAGVHDDQVDASSGAYEKLHSRNQSKVTSAVRTPTRQPALRTVGM
jgi:predicted phage terminase large subunit-like protein